MKNGDCELKMLLTNLNANFGNESDNVTVLSSSISSHSVSSDTTLNTGLRDFGTALRSFGKVLDEMEK